MNTKITRTLKVDWELPKPMLYTMSWKNKDGETICKEHLPLEDVKDMMTAIHNQNEYHDKPIVTEIKVIGEF